MRRPGTCVLPVLLGLAAALPAGAATPLETRHPRATVTIDFLLEACTVVGETAHGMIPHFDCESWLYGVLDAQAALAAATSADATTAAAAAACVPAKLAPWQVYAMLVEAEIPDSRRGEPAAAFVLELLRAKAGCADVAAVTGRTSIAASAPQAGSRLSE